MSSASHIVTPRSKSTCNTCCGQSLPIFFQWLRNSIDPSGGNFRCKSLHKILQLPLNEHLRCRAKEAAAGCSKWAVQKISKLPHMLHVYLQHVLSESCFLDFPFVRNFKLPQLPADVLCVQIHQAVQITEESIVRPGPRLPGKPSG